MKFLARGIEGEVEIEGLTPAGLPALRLVQYHSPQVSLACRVGSVPTKLALGVIDLNPSFVPHDSLNTDRAQLAKIGG